MTGWMRRKRAVKDLEKGQQEGGKWSHTATYSWTLFVCNLPFDATRHDLLEIFR
jgi:hypothetical protein